MQRKLKEECGIFGIYSMDKEEDLASTMCIGLSALQHRGEESAGIAINNGGILSCTKDLGLVSDVFKPHITRANAKRKNGYRSCPLFYHWFSTKRKRSTNGN
jgi:amidophosphoribosyltransferase